MSCQAGPGIEPGPSALKESALPIELTWQTTSTDIFNNVSPKKIISFIKSAGLYNTL